MLSIINSMALHGLDGYLVSVQVDVASGMPCFEIVGLPDTSVKESKERVKTAIKNSGVEFFSRRVIVNLAPANTKKEGSIFDLPIAVGILIAMEAVSRRKAEEQLNETVVLGELSLDGKINKINGVLPICIEAARIGMKRIILPKENAKEASIVKNIEILPVESLVQVIQFLNGMQMISKEENIEMPLQQISKYSLDFSEVKGQENAKRALEIAAARWTQLLTYSVAQVHGKTMLARRIPSILPDISFEEALEVTKIHSIAGLLSEETPMILTRPFRSPHHTISGVSLVGGGRVPKPGEISLAHYGVLFLDELPEFNKNTLEVLRGPLEDRVVTISRVNAALTYPCNFMFIASMNPCPCGYYGSKEKECTCTPEQIKKYMGRISGPLLDRIDIHLEVSGVKYEKLNCKNEVESSENIRKRVNKARKIQIERYKEYGIYSNSELSPKLIDIYCKLNSQSSKILESSFQKLGLSARAYGRILKVARTIADLDGQENIQTNHLAEAIQYRNLDRKYWQH